MTQRKIIYSEIALSKRKAIKRDIKEKYGQEREDFLYQMFGIATISQDTLDYWNE